MYPMDDFASTVEKIAVLVIPAIVLIAIIWLYMLYNNKKPSIRCRKHSKLVYRNWQDAERAAWCAWVSGIYLRAYYECECGSWHLTSKRPQS